MSTASTATTNAGWGQYLLPATNALSYIYNKGSELCEKAQQPGPTQKTTQAAIRSFVGIASIYLSPRAAAVGATAALIKPELVKTGCSLVEGAIMALWNNTSFKQKAGLAAVGVASAYYCDPTTIFSVLGTAFAVKLGAELAIRNLSKEELAEAVQKAADQLELKG